MRECADEIERLRAERKGEIDANRGHAYWETAPREELLDAFRFQGAMTKALIRQVALAAGERDALRALLERCRPVIESEAALMDSMARHMAGGFPAEDVASADKSADFHYVLLKDIDAALGKGGS